MNSSPRQFAHTGISRSTLLGLIICLCVVLLWGGATRGEMTLTFPQGSQISQEVTPAPPPPDEGEADDQYWQLPPEAEGNPVDLSGLWRVLRIIGLAMVGIGIMVILLRLLAELRRSRDVAPTSDAGRLLTVTDPEVFPDLTRLDEGITAALGELAEKSQATDAIIAAWVALEDAAAQAGIPKAPHQTATEFTGWVLAKAQVEPAAIAELMALYHRARFSSHPVTAADAGSATTLLHRIQRSWQVT